MKLFALTIVLLGIGWAFYGAQPAFAQSPSPADAMASANDLYNSERYQEAARSYERLVGLGHEDEDLFYNLGNAYYRQDDLGRAILNYLKAQRLAPRDGDIQANLSFVQSQTVDELEPAEFGNSLTSFANAMPFESTNTTAGLMLVAWIAFAGSIAWWVIKAMPSIKHPSLITAGITGALLVLSAILLTGSLQSESEYDDTTVIVASEVGVMSGPGPQYAEEFILHSGAETELIEVRGNWSRIRVPATDLQGWIPRRAVESVVPSNS